MALLIFDLETTPDYQAIARAKGLPPNDLSAAKAALAGDFPKHAFHKIVVIGYMVVVPGERRYEIAEFGADHCGDMSEKTMLDRFMRRVEIHSPILVTFNGSSFDMPVLRYRAMVNGVSGQRLTIGKAFHRYERSHIDLCDELASFDARAKMKLNEVCAALDLPGKTDGMDGGLVEDYVEAGRIAEVAEYCKDDVAATYRVWLALTRFNKGTADETYRANLDHVDAIASGMDPDTSYKPPRMGMG